MAIAISAGTTTHTLAARVAEIPGVTVVTNWVRVAEVLYRSGRRDQTVVLTGGVRTPSEALVVPFAVAQLRSVHLDLVFMGVHGMDGKAGFTCPNLSEAETDRALIESGRRLVVLADHTKWGVIGISLDRPPRPGRRPGLGHRARRGRPGDAARRGGRADPRPLDRTIDAGPGGRPRRPPRAAGTGRQPCPLTTRPDPPTRRSRRLPASRTDAQRADRRVGPCLGRPDRPAVAGRRGARAAR